MILVVFPHQLFADHPGLEKSPSTVVLIEDSLFFGDKRYPANFHQQKLWFHRSSMKRFAAELDEDGYAVQYIDYDENRSLAEQLRSVQRASRGEGESICCVDPTDFVLEKRLRRAAKELQCDLELLPNPGFLNSRQQNQEYRSGRKRWYMADFYKFQRKRLGLLIEDGEPTGGQWSFDKDNRKKIPKRELDSIPQISSVDRDDFDREAVEYVQDRFSEHPGNLQRLHYPTDRRQATRWLDEFLSNRFERFGDYEDAIEQGESWLWHSVLTPMLNVGLLTPHEVIDRTMRYAQENDVPINSLEGFVRQVIGWREFMRATYEDLGVSMRTTNHWEHHRAMPKSFYDASTGIEPIDDTIRRLLDTGYCHHIERLMVLGGFMFLCEIDPDEIYRWFMEMFIDSYDWVMVPNVYAMSQNADGGQITTKPYFSGSSYVRKMSHYSRGSWCDVWDGLYWRWIWNHADALQKNPRWAMMCASVKKMDESKRDEHLANAESFLSTLCL